MSRKWKIGFLGAVAKPKPHRAHLYESPAFRRLRATFSQNLRRLREQNGLTQEAAGEKCGGMSMQQYQFLESGDANITMRTIARIVDGLGVHANELFRGSARGKPKRS